MESIIQNIVLYLNKTSIKVQEECMDKIKAFVNTVDKEKVKLLEIIMKEKDFLGDIIEICISSLTKVFEDGNVGMNDIPLLVDMIMDIITKIKSKNIEAELESVLELSGFICKVIIICINKSDYTEVFIKILDSSIKLIKFNPIIDKKLLYCCL